MFLDWVYVEDKKTNQRMTKMTPEEHMQEAYYDYCDNEERAGHIGAPFAVWKAAQLKARATQRGVRAQTSFTK